MLFDNTLGRSCIIMLNRIGAIIEPCGIPISIVLLDEYVYIIPRQAGGI